MKQYKLPNRKLKLITKEFLQTFKIELDNTFSVESSLIHIPFDKRNYWNYYQNLDSTGGFYKALKITCQKYNLEKAIYEYFQSRSWYISDYLDSELTELMYKLGVIDEGSIDELDDMNNPQNIQWLQDTTDKNEIQWYKIVNKKNGYNVLEYDYCYLEDKDELLHKMEEEVIFLDKMPQF